MEHGRSPGSRRTRSQMALDWTVSEMLTLVNEIAAVEGDCLKALSSYQKWKIIAENCCALDVVRTSNQCRRKWDSLLDNYRKVKLYESRSDHCPYRSLDRDKRNQLGLPDEFDHELFVTMGKFLEEQEDRSDTEPDSDQEAQTEVPNDNANSPGPVRQREALVKAKPRDRPPKGKERRTCSREAIPEMHSEEGPPKCLPDPNADRHGYSDLKRPRRGQSDAREETIVDEYEERLETVMLDSLNMIQEIVKECDHESADTKIAEEQRGDVIRVQADKLIACLGSVVESLHQFNQVCGSE